MKQIFFFPILSFLVLSCSSKNSSNSVIDGDYEGSFNRESPNAFNPSSEVSLTFDNGSFEGVSSMNDYPAICNGTYEINKSEITFENECVFTADFDWTFILDGTFEFQFIENELRIRKEYGSQTYDTYILTSSQ